MVRENIQVELSLYIKAEKPADLPLEIYDALYYSGHFDPIYRVQGDMVLSAYYNDRKKAESRARKLGKRLLKELTIDLKDKPKGTEVKVENLMPVFEEENAFYRDPKVRISTKSHTTSSRLAFTVHGLTAVLESTEQYLLGIDKLKKMGDARLVITLSDGEFNSPEMKEIHSSLGNRGMRSSNTKHTWSIDFRREQLEKSLLADIASVIVRASG